MIVYLFRKSCFGPCWIVECVGQFLASSKGGGEGIWRRCLTPIPTPRGIRGGFKKKKISTGPKVQCCA